MSGPKTSQYTLTAEQRRILAEQRKIRTQCELMTVLQKETRSIIAQADRIIEKMEPLLAEIRGDSSNLAQVKQLRLSATEAFNRSAQMNDSSGLAALQEVNTKLREISRKLETHTKSLQKEHSFAERSFRKEMNERISDGFDVYFDSFSSDNGNKSSSYFHKIQSELEQIASLKISSAQLSKLQLIQEKVNEIENADFLKNYYAMTVVPYVKECRAYHAAYSAYGEAYEQKRVAYELNAQALGIATEKIPFSPEAVSLLDEKIQETEAAIRFRDEQAYISRCVDEAMREMGYSVLGNREVVKRNGKKFRNELYLFDEGTAVNVTYSSDGQITMELGGIANDNRIPSDAESVGLVADMRTFCDDYHEIERRLRQKGIISKRISILPPDKQFAQMINVSDYTLCAEASEYEAKRQRKQAANNASRKLGE